jgi:hypothetical protein
MKDNILIGKTLTGMKIAEDRQALLFQTGDGDIVVRVDADCCSYTWVESIELPSIKLAHERLSKAAVHGFTTGPIGRWGPSEANCAAAAMERANHLREETEWLRAAMKVAYGLLVYASPDETLVEPSKWTDECDAWLDEFAPSKLDAR